MNSNEIFRKYASYDNIKSHKKAGLQPFSRKYRVGKTTGRVNLASKPFICETNTF